MSAKTGKGSALHEGVTLRFSEHDTLPEAWARWVDQGLGDANDAAAPLHEVRPLAIFVHGGEGSVIGGAVGRTWGESCELQQLWVHPDHRRQGLGAQIVHRFERRAATRGVRHFYLETWSFQAPRLYAALGYRTTHSNSHFPHGLVKHLMEKAVAAEAKQDAEGVVREFWRRMQSNRFDTVAGLLADDFTLEWPQSGERIRGAANFVRMNAEYPSRGPWRFELGRVVASGDQVVTEVAVTDGTTHGLAISFFGVVFGEAGGRIARLVEYWPEPFAARADRAHLTERAG